MPTDTERIAKLEKEVAALRVQIRVLESFLATILPTEKEPLLGPNTQATYRQEIEAALRKIGQ